MSNNNQEAICVSQQFARDFLESLGLNEEQWQGCLEKRLMSHMARSLIRVANGDRRSLIEIYNAERADDGVEPASIETLTRITSAAKENVEHLSSLA